MKSDLPKRLEELDSEMQDLGLTEIVGGFVEHLPKSVNELSYHTNNNPSKVLFYAERYGKGYMLRVYVPFNEVGKR